MPELEDNTDDDLPRSPFLGYSVSALHQGLRRICEHCWSPENGVGYPCGIADHVTTILGSSGLMASELGSALLLILRALSS